MLASRHRGPQHEACACTSEQPARLAAWPWKRGALLFQLLSPVVVVVVLLDSFPGLRNVLISEEFDFMLSNELCSLFSKKASA